MAICGNAQKDSSGVMTNNYSGIHLTGWQSGLKFNRKNFSIEGGTFYTVGDLNGEIIMTPFQTDLIVKAPLYEFDLGLRSGSLSYYGELNVSKFTKKGDFSLWAIFIRTDLNDGGGVTEYNIIAKYQSKSPFYVAVKSGYISYDGFLPVDKTIFDYRLFLGIKL